MNFRERLRELWAGLLFRMAQAPQICLCAGLLFRMAHPLDRRMVSFTNTDEFYMLKQLDGQAPVTVQGSLKRRIC